MKYNFEYDSNGNILKRHRCYYDYANSSVTDEYGYTTVRSGCNHNPAWGDQLRKYGKDVVKYDKLGNITNYNGRRLEWKGKNLSSINGCVIMDYDHNGLRVKKTFGDSVKKYYWCDNRLIMERCKEGNEKDGYKILNLYFYYDESGVCGMRYDNGTIKEDYHYLKNIFGDIIGIYDRYGECICKYVYDAWGNHKVLDNNGKEIFDYDNIGVINPFRYRGYYYDAESAIYYLQSRYYEPMIGRFLSPDTSAINPQSVSGFNMYAFCDNNPVGFAYSGSGIGGINSAYALSGLSDVGNYLGCYNPINIFAGLNWPQLKAKDLIKNILINFCEIGSRVKWAFTNDGRSFLEFHYSAYGINGYTALDKLPSPSAKIFKGISFGLMALDVLEAGYYSYQNGHSFDQGVLNIGLTAGKNYLVYRASTRTAALVGTWAGAKLGASLGSAAGPVGFAIGAVAGAFVGWIIDGFGDVIIEWVVGWFD